MNLNNIQWLSHYKTKIPFDNGVWFSQEIDAIIFWKKWKKDLLNLFDSYPEILLPTLVMHEKDIFDFYYFSKSLYICLEPIENNSFWIREINMPRMGIKWMLFIIKYAIDNNVDSITLWACSSDILHTRDWLIEFYKSFWFQSTEKERHIMYLLIDENFYQFIYDKIINYIATWKFNKNIYFQLYQRYSEIFLIKVRKK